MKKKVLGLVLVLMMLISVFSFTAFAEEHDSAEIKVDDGNTYSLYVDYSHSVTVKAQDSEATGVRIKIYYTGDSDNLEGDVCNLICDEKTEEGLELTCMLTPDNEGYYYIEGITLFSAEEESSSSYCLYASKFTSGEDSVMVYSSVNFTKSNYVNTLPFVLGKKVPVQINCWSFPDVGDYKVDLTVSKNGETIKKKSYALEGYEDNMNKFYFTPSEAGTYKVAYVFTFEGSKVYSGSYKVKVIKPSQVKKTSTKTYISTDSEGKKIYFYTGGIGGTEKIKIYRSSKKNSGYKLYKTKKADYYVGCSINLPSKNYYYKISQVVTVNGKTYETPLSNAVRTYSIDRPVIKSVKSSKGNVTLKWASVKGAYSYIVSIKTPGEDEYNDTAYVEDKTSYTISGLSQYKGEKVSVKVRALVSKGKYSEIRSRYSKYKTIKVK